MQGVTIASTTSGQQQSFCLHDLPERLDNMIRSNITDPELNGLIIGFVRQYIGQYAWDNQLSNKVKSDLTIFALDMAQNGLKNFAGDD